MYRWLVVLPVGLKIIAVTLSIEIKPETISNLTPLIQCKLLKLLFRSLLFTIGLSSPRLGESLPVSKTKVPLGKNCQFSLGSQRWKVYIEPDNVTIQAR